VTATPSADAAIDLRAVTKVYRGNVVALQGVSLRVNRGEVFGLLGPNGAGKSTLIKIMMTVVRPTAASGTLLGERVGHKPTLARVGYLPEHHRFPRYLTGRQTLEFFAALSGVGRADRRRRAGELIDVVGMTAWAAQKVGAYSKGMMQRIGLAQALVNDPDLVLLDEPTDGVDPGGRRDIRDVLLRMRDGGQTVFINSHLLGELEMVCGRVAIMVGGRIERQGTMDELTDTRGRYEIEVEPHFEVNIESAVAPLLAGGGARTLATGIAVEFGPAMMRVDTTDAAAIQDLLDAVRRAGLAVRRVQAIRPSLEDLFIEAVTDADTGGRRPPGATRQASFTPATGGEP
jgi:ABC-2 type transport system ATP-binding protein